MTREEVKELLLSQCKILNTYSWSDDRKAYDVPQYVLSDSKTLKLIDQIYNDHEEQLKVKDEEIEKYKSLHNLAKGSLNKASDYTRLLENSLKLRTKKSRG